MIRELAVPLIYLDEKRSFGGELDHAETRLRHYGEVISRSIRRNGRLLHQRLASRHHNRTSPFFSPALFPAVGLKKPEALQS